MTSQVQSTDSTPEPAALTGSQLVDELNALGVFFLRGGSGTDAAARIAPITFLTALATSPEARLRLALIPLWLKRPDFATDASLVGSRLPLSAQIGFKCYYTAARLLQQKYRFRLETLQGQCQPLPDLFSADLDLPTSHNPETALRSLAERHQALSGQRINWLGTYEHAAQRFLVHLARRKSWKT